LKEEEEAKRHHYSSTAARKMRDGNKNQACTPTKAN